MPELFIQLATVTPKSLDQIRDLPPGLADVVQKGLSKQREDRFQSTSAMALALAPYADARSELVLRKLAQRGSVRVTRPGNSPSNPTLGGPPLESPPLTGAKVRESGTLHSVSKSHVVAGQSVALNAEQSAKSRRSSKLLLGGLVSALLAAGAWFAFAMRAPSPAVEPDKAVEAPRAVAKAERVEPAREPAPVEAAQPTPAAASASSVAAAPSAGRAPGRPQAALPQAVAAAGSARAPEPKQPLPEPSAKPLLKKIGIQD
jgi:hypothetical protein